MKRIVVSALFCFLMATALMLTGCGGSALEKAYNDLAEDEDANTEVHYDADQDLLWVVGGNNADLDALFETLNKRIEGEEIGQIYFDCGRYADSLDAIAMDEKIPELAPASIKMLGVDFEIASLGHHNWTKLAEKSDRVYVDTVSSISGYTAEETANIKKLWVGSSEVMGINSLPGLTELGIMTSMECQDTEEQENSSGEAADSTEAQESTEMQESSASGGEGAEGEGAEGEGAEGESVEATTFDEMFSDPVSALALKKLQNLEHIYIMPQEPAYTLSSTGAGYIYTLQNVIPDVMINKPDEAFSEENLIKIREVDISAINENPTLKATTLESFLRSEVEDCYKTCKKFNKSSDKPKIQGKALIYKATPDTDDWTDKRKFHSSGTIITAGDLDNKVATPEFAGDYETFIYVYPVYTRTGVYTSGTKAYSETYKAQVFDMKNKIAYEAEKIDTEPAPQKFSYYVGSMPDKHAGSVSDKKIYKYLKKL